jgi:hypothetical protein
MFADEERLRTPRAPTLIYKLLKDNILTFRLKKSTASGWRFAPSALKPWPKRKNNFFKKLSSSLKPGFGRVFCCRHYQILSMAQAGNFSALFFPMLLKSDFFLFVHRIF